MRGGRRGKGQEDIGRGKGEHAKVGQDPHPHPHSLHPVDNRILSVRPERLGLTSLQTLLKGVGPHQDLIRVSVRSTDDDKIGEKKTLDKK